MPPLLFLLLLTAASVVSARFLHASGYHNSTRTLYVFGGASSSPSIVALRTVQFDVSGLNYTDQELLNNDLSSVVGFPVGSHCVAPSAAVGLDSSSTGYNIVCLGGDGLQAHPYAFDTTNQKSTYVVTTSLLGVQVYGAAGVILGDAIVFYGGFYDANVGSRAALLSNSTATPSARLVRYGPLPTLGPGSDVTTTNLDLVSQFPSLARGFHAAAAVQSGIVVGFGVGANASVLADAFLIDGSNRIVRQSVVGDSPSARVGASAIALDATRVMFYGGRLADGSFSGEVFILDTANSPWRWSKVQPVGAGGPERAFHTADLVGRFMVVYGGLTVGGADVEDIAFFDTVGLEWGPPKTNMFGPGVPPAATGPVNTAPATAPPGSSPFDGSAGLSTGVATAIAVSVFIAATAIGVAVFMFAKYRRKKLQFQTLEMIQMESELPPPYDPTQQRRESSSAPAIQSPSQHRYSFLSFLSPSSASVASEPATPRLGGQTSVHSSTNDVNSVESGPMVDAFGLNVRTTSRPIPQPQRDSVVSIGSGTSSQRWLMEPQYRSANVEEGVGIARVVASHKPLLDDEIPVREGETVQVLRFFDDGWALGRTAGGIQGFFPMSLVRMVETKRIVEEDEDEDDEEGGEASGLGTSGAAVRQ